AFFINLADVQRNDSQEKQLQSDADADQSDDRWPACLERDEESCDKKSGQGDASQNHQRKAKADGELERQFRKVENSVERKLHFALEVEFGNARESLALVDFNGRVLHADLHEKTFDEAVALVITQQIITEFTRKHAHHGDSFG